MEALSSDVIKTETIHKVIAGAKLMSKFFWNVLPLQLWWFRDVSSFSTENYNWKKKTYLNVNGFEQASSQSETDVYSMSNSLQMQIINRPF